MIQNFFVCKEDSMREILFLIIATSMTLFVGCHIDNCLKKALVLIDNAEKKIEAHKGFTGVYFNKIIEAQTTLIKTATGDYHTMDEDEDGFGARCQDHLFLVNGKTYKSYGGKAIPDEEYPCALNTREGIDMAIDLFKNRLIEGAEILNDETKAKKFIKKTEKGYLIKGEYSAGGVYSYYYSSDGTTFYYEDNIEKVTIVFDDTINVVLPK